MKGWYYEGYWDFEEGSWCDPPPNPSAAELYLAGWLDAMWDLEYCAGAYPDPAIRSICSKGGQAPRFPTPS